MLRWTSPVTHMARTATRDVEIRGQRIREGDTVVMLYGSANRDEEIFGADAEEFKVTRIPIRTSHSAAASTRASGHSWPVSKPASSSRCCWGDTPKLELVGDVDRMRATMVPGVKRMPVRLGTGS